IHSTAAEGRSQVDTRPAPDLTGPAERTTLLAQLTARTTDAAHDAFTPGALGHHAGNVYARSTLHPASAHEIAQLTGSSLARTAAILDTLVEDGVLLADARGYRRPQSEEH